METPTKDEAVLADIKGAFVRTYAAEFGFVKMTEQPALKSFAGAAALFGEGPFGDWSGTVHNPIPDNPNVSATNIHVSDAWMLPVLVERLGRCFRVFDSDIHFFCADDAAEAALRAWIKSLPAPDAPPPHWATIAGFPYGVRGGNPSVSTGTYAIEHIAGRPDCHFYNWFPAPNAGGKSGSPSFATNGPEMNPDPFGINVARGYTWQVPEGEDSPRPNHWAVVQCYHNAMTLTAAV